MRHRFQLSHTWRGHFVSPMYNKSFRYQQGLFLLSTKNNNLKHTFSRKQKSNGLFVDMFSRCRHATVQACWMVIDLHVASRGGRGVGRGYGSWSRNGLVFLIIQRKTELSFSCIRHFQKVYLTNKQFLRGGVGILQNVPKRCTQHQLSLTAVNSATTTLDSPDHQVPILAYVMVKFIKNVFISFIECGCISFGGQCVCARVHIKCSVSFKQASFYLHSEACKIQ